jgi:hypothetical protein
MFLSKVWRERRKRSWRPPSHPRRSWDRFSLEPCEDRTLLSASFGTPVTFPVGLQPGAAVTADLRGDGKQDIVVLNQGQFPDRVSSVSVLLGNGDGSFQPAITTNLLPGATSLAVGDFNRDGKPDLAITSGLTNSVEILRGNGDGTFQANPLIIPVGTQQNFTESIQSVAVGDFLHNGKLDLAVANPGSNTVSVLLGNGDGTFQLRVDYAVGAVPLSVAASDLGNGQVDLVVVNHDSSNVSVLLGKGDGTFQPARNIDVKAQSSLGAVDPVTLRVGDFTGDGKPDLLISQLTNGDVVESFVSVLPGNGDGTFQAPITQDVGFELVGLAVGHFTGTGKLDFAMAQPFVGGVDVFPGNGDGTFGAPSLFAGGGADPCGRASGDFNGDGRPDLAVLNTFSNTVGVLLNTSGPVAAATTTTLGTSAATAVFGQKETLTATVNSAVGTPSGTVNFFDGTTVLGTGTLDAAGQATLTVSLGVGTHSLTATYLGNSAFGASRSAAVTETVNRAATAVALSSSINLAVVGQKVSFTATVTAVAPGAGTPAGTVTFFDGNNTLGTVAVGTGGKATFMTSFSTTGSHAIKAVYNGDGDFAGSSRTVTEQVHLSSRIALGASSNPVPVGRPVTFTAAVIPASGTITPTGTITFMDGDVVLAKVTLVDGKATLTRSFSTKGSHIITAIYSGDSLFAANLQTLTELVS